MPKALRISLRTCYLGQTQTSSHNTIELCITIITCVLLKKAKNKKQINICRKYLGGKYFLDRDTIFELLATCDIFDCSIKHMVFKSYNVKEFSL